MLSTAIRFGRFASVLVLLAFSSAAFAKDTPLAVIDWPSAGTPVVRFTFSKFKPLPGMGSLRGYVMDTTAENLSNRVIPSARFSVYLFDKAKVRVGEDVIGLGNVGPGETCASRQQFPPPDSPCLYPIKPGPTHRGPFRLPSTPRPRARF
jgi:hypothetical protein